MGGRHPCERHAPSFQTFFMSFWVSLVILSPSCHSERSEESVQPAGRQLTVPQWFIENPRRKWNRGLSIFGCCSGCY